MFIITVTPLDKGIFKEELTYFSKILIEPGALVSVPVRGRDILSLVISTKSASDIKAGLKKSDFSLKKVTDVVHPGIFNPNFLQAAREAAQYFGVSFGMSLKFATPKAILDSLSNKKWPKPKVYQEKTLIGPAATRPDNLSLQESPSERIGFYRSLIREAFAHGQSVFVLVPTTTVANRLASHLGKGIESYTKVLHSKISDEEIITEWKSALENDHPTLYLATPLFLSVPKKNIGLIIVENEGSDHYEPVTRPYIDARRLAEYVARAGRIRLIFGDTALRPETIYRTEKKELISAAPLKYRLPAGLEKKIVDMRRPAVEGEKAVFKIIGPDIESLVQEAQTRKKKIFLLVGRLGLAPTTVCNDCDTILACTKCDQPLVLYDKKDKNRLYSCRRCGNEETPTDRCPVCGGWRLSTMGIGTDTVAQTLRQTKLPIFIIDSEHSKTPIQATKTMTAFTESTQSAILIGTEMALPHLSEQVDYVGVVSLDHFFALPGFRVREKMARIISDLSEIAQKKIIIQTRRPEESIWQYIESGNLLDFYRNEIRDREASGWPPFSVLIKITRVGPESAVEKDMTKLTRLLEPYNPITYPSFGPAARGHISLNLLIKIPPTDWPDEELSAVLLALPPVFIVNVEPADIL